MADILTPSFGGLTASKSVDGDSELFKGGRLNTR